MTTIAAQGSGSIALSNPISQLTSTVAGGVAGGAASVALARKFAAGRGVAGLAGLGLAALTGVAGARLGGIAGARLGADMPGPATTAGLIGGGAVLGAAVGALTRRVPVGLGAVAGSAAGIAAARLVGPDMAPALDVVGQVDANRYAGLWYEVARIPTTFQAEGTVSTALYTPAEDGSLKVRNTSYLRGRETASIDGAAVPLTPENNRLNVGFGGFLKLVPKPNEGNYWIIDLADDYSMALVGDPGRNTLFLLARDPNAAGSPQAEAMLETARAQGFDVDSMVIADWDQQVSAPRGSVQS